MAPWVVHVTNARGEAEGAPLRLVARGDIPNIFLSPGGRKNDAAYHGRVVANKEATQRIHVVGNLPPFQITDKAALEVEPNAELVVVMHRSVIHLAAKVDEGDVVGRRRLLTKG